MGVSVSKNVVNSLIQNTQSIINNYENICTSTGDAALAQFQANGCVLDNDKIIIGTRQNINQTCIQSGETRDNMTNDVTQSMQQSAQAITQSFGFPSLALSESFISDSILLGQSIVNNYLNKCTTDGLQSGSSFNCATSTIKNSVIQIESYQDITQQCTQKYINSTDLVSRLENTLSQSAVAKNQNTFAVFGAIFIILILVFAYAGISLADNPLVEWGIVILVAISLISTVVYSISAKKYNNYPYNRT